MTPLNKTFLSLILLGSLPCGAATLDQVISSARAQVGSEQALKSVRTVQYQGKVFDADGTETGTLTLQFKSPTFQRLQLDSEEFTETTGVNGFEGWRERINKSDPRQSGILVLPPVQVQYLLANARENLNFFQGPRGVPGGKIELLGEKTVRGRETWEVLYSYPSGLTYTRYFDRSSGELVATLSGDTGFEMVEKGTLKAGGISFPKAVQTYKDGVLIRYVEFDEILVNEPLEEALFDFPALPGSRGKRP